MRRGRRLPEITPEIIAQAWQTLAERPLAFWDDLKKDMPEVAEDVQKQANINATHGREIDVEESAKLMRAAAYPYGVVKIAFEQMNNMPRRRALAIKLRQLFGISTSVESSDGGEHAQPLTEPPDDQPTVGHDAFHPYP